jgi:predicted thioredoxin/glutaredoxin
MLRELYWLKIKKIEGLESRIKTKNKSLFNIYIKQAFLRIETPLNSGLLILDAVPGKYHIFVTIK